MYIMLYEDLRIEDELGFMFWPTIVIPTKIACILTCIQNVF